MAIVLEPATSSARATLGNGVMLRLVQWSDGGWYWRQWQRWKRAGHLTEIEPIAPPSVASQDRGFATVEEATDYFRSLVDVSRGKKDRS